MVDKIWGERVSTNLFRLQQPCTKLKDRLKKKRKRCRYPVDKQFFHLKIQQQQHALQEQQVLQQVPLQVLQHVLQQFPQQFPQQVLQQVLLHVLQLQQQVPKQQQLK